MHAPRTRPATYERAASAALRATYAPVYVRNPRKFVTYGSTAALCPLSRPSPWLRHVIIRREPIAKRGTRSDAADPRR